MANNNVYQKIGFKWVVVYKGAIDFSVGKEGKLFVIKEDGELVVTRCYAHMETLLRVRKAFWKTK